MITDALTLTYRECAAIYNSVVDLYVLDFIRWGDPQREGENTEEEKRKIAD
jgi:hypothetical protein